MAMAKNPRFHIVMYPWFAFGHMIPYLHLSNELAERGHSITFILPKKVQSQLQHLNLHPTLISFHPVTIPHVDGLPPGAETASDVPISLHHLLATAMDRTTDQVEAALRALKPDFLFYDMAYWAAPLASKLAALANCLVRAQQISKSRPIPTGPPPGYPSSTVVLRPHEACLLQFLLFPFGEDITFHERLTAAIKRCDVVSIRTCQEIEGPFCDYIERRFEKPVFVTGPVLVEPSPLAPEDRWAQWLGGFKPGSVIFCAFGSQNFPEKDQFQELLLGFELTGLPFLAALKPPLGAATIEEALPEGFQERVGGRGVVHGGWVPQPSILSHPSVGCFVSHCGFGSMWESLMSDPQIVVVPELCDQTFNARLLAEELKVAVEVEKEENGWVSKESLCKAIKSVMDEEGEVGCLVKKNHAKWKETLMSQGFMSNYIDNFVRQLLDLK
ncbi:hypothetical protein PVL29_025323 [Vitis rotundifolia]|uniref:Glycosyltransferase n=1 Tax=Vitis rotundifolia TaxID=103349 RepID=A0AA39D570_VITRO|nr:hypothetical protein PVL29_025323 [Vitis rotundifolia]